VTPGSNPEGKPLFGSVAADNPAIDVTFEGLACDAKALFETYCVAGTFDFHISKTTIGTVSFEDQHLSLRGGSCAYEPTGACPAP
jgi:hypothetical protein